MKLILYAIPGFFFLILAEWLYGLARGHNTYRLADTITSISLGGVSRMRGLLFLGFGAWFYTRASAGAHLFELPDQGIGIWLLALVAYDFSYYWFHRISHEVNLFWAAHVVHHQSEDYNLGTALRQSGSSLFGFVFYLPWLAIGIPPEIFFASGAISLIYQFWVHTEHIPKLGPLEYVFVTASNHRVHHAQNTVYIDRNYGAILIIWDRMFGSFQEELADIPCVYGIRKPLQSYNPLWANVHVYWSTLLASWHTPRWQDKLKVWLKGPGWQPAQNTLAEPAAQSPLANFSKYDPPVSRVAGSYAFFQFFCTLLISTGLLITAKNWDTTTLATIVGLVFFSYYLQSAWTEGRRFALAAEWLKLTLAVTLLIYLPLQGAVLTGLEVYLVISVLVLLWLSLQPAATAGTIKQEQSDPAVDEG